jgi:hypothetical protein
MCIGLLICTLISKNQGLEKSRSIFQTLKKKQVLQTLIFFSGLHPEKKLGLYYKCEKIPGAKPKKKSRFAGPEFFLGKGLK